MTEITKVRFNAKVFNSNPTSDIAPIYCHGTTCCALTLMSVQNYHTVKEIKAAIDHIRKDSLSRKFTPAEREFGERNIMVITTPSETKLEAKLLEAGFTLLKEGLPRRNGYPPGTLKIFLYSF